VVQQQLFSINDRKHDKSAAPEERRGPPPKTQEFHRKYRCFTINLQTKGNYECQYNDEFKLTIRRVVLDRTAIIKPENLILQPAAPLLSHFALTIKLVALKNNSLFCLVPVAFMPNGVIGRVARERKRGLNVDSCTSIS
jgi:hypothetical protein